MKNIFKIVSCFAIASALFLGSCTEKFEEYNVDERGVTEEQLQGDYYFIGGFFPQIQQMIYCNFDWGWGTNWPYQIMQNLNADIFSGYMMTPTPFAGNVNNQNYAMVDGWNGSNWDYTYAYFMPVVHKVEGITEVDYPSFNAVAKILKVTGMHRISDQYGPIIYSHYGDSKTGGEFDAQQDAYNAFFADLDTAVEILTSYIAENPDAQPFAAYDLLFAGDYSEWIRFANSLRLRLAMRISNVDPTTAQTQAEKAVNGNSYGLLTVDAAVAGYDYSNPLAAIANSWGDIKIGAPIESIMRGYNDPRIEKYMTPTTDQAVLDAGYTYKGIRQGIDILDKATYVNHSSINIDTDYAPRLMSVSETYFLLAEAALNGWNVGGDSKSFYESGVQASFDQWGASIGEYLSSSALPAPFVDVLRTDDVNNIAAGSSYLNNVSPSYDEATTDEERLQKIITQKWLAMFPEGMEAWSEFRRTGYPVLFPVVNNLSGGDIPEGEFVKRLNFSVTEKEANPEGYQQAVSALKGPDHAGTSLWWDVD